MKLIAEGFKDNNNNIIICKCGKPAGMAICGKESFIARCEDCWDMPKLNGKFIYKLPIRIEL